MTTESDDNIKGAIKQLEDMRLAGVQFDRDAGEEMRNAEDNITQINEVQRTCMEAITENNQAVYSEATRQATTTGRQILSEIDSRLQAMGAEI